MNPKYVRVTNTSIIIYNTKNPINLYGLNIIKKIKKNKLIKKFNIAQTNGVFISAAVIITIMITRVSYMGII